MVRYLDKELDVKQHLVRVHTMATSLSDPELARDLVMTLSTELQLWAQTDCFRARQGYC